MSTTIIVWLRNDLRIEDNPALSAAVKSATYVIPLFILDEKLLTASSNRTKFLLESLRDLKHSLQERGGDLAIRKGEPVGVLSKIATETNADALYYAADYTPYSTIRDKKVDESLNRISIETKRFPGRLIVDDIEKVKTKSDTPYKVFSPFHRSWATAKRRPLASAPSSLSLPTGFDTGKLPLASDYTKFSQLSPRVQAGGESAAKKRLAEFLNSQVRTYHETHNDMAADNTSRLSAYLHFGCVSPLWIESQLGDSDGEQAFARQLAWRDFYHTILYNFPTTPDEEFQERYRTLYWNKNDEHLDAWKQGKTGYPIVDAAMRQLLNEGWMHNRGRLIVGSFLTKDLQLDWRLGEEHFMKWLIDGDPANNIGNWQWIASVGVDPAPLFRRLYNPTSQAKNYDPKHEYIRRYVPELRNVPDAYIAEPWKMSQEIQIEADCIIGEDYPAPIVDHATAREETIARYKSAGQ